MPRQASPRPAAVNDVVRQGTAVRTGADSRTELTFADLTITRLGANTVFSFKPAARDLNLISGAVLIQVTPGAPEVRVTSSAVSAAISGGTAIFDATTGKFMVLEGIGRVWPTGHPELAVTVHAGELVWLTPDGHISQPEPFDVKLVMETSLLITDFAQLPNYNLIAQVMDAQPENGSENPPLPPFKTNEDIISQRDAASPAPTASLSGTPSKFGPPQTISSPVPYVIDSTTVITTDPTIITGNRTDFGKIYQGASIDGPFSSFVFGSTSSFDTSSGFDSQINNSGAGFKFTALQLAGNPTVVTLNGETNLGLIGVNGITSATPGGPLTFTGIKGLLLATVNGPIILGSGLSFSGMNDFTAYARGTASDLALGSGVNVSTKIRLYAEHDINVTSSLHAPLMFFVAGHDLNFVNFASLETVNTIGNVSLQASNNITSQQQIQINRSNGGGSPSLNLNLNAGHDLMVGTDLLLSVDNSGTSLDSGAAIGITANGTLTTGGTLDATLNNGNGGVLGSDALVQVAASKVTTGSDFALTINNSPDGRINGNATISLNVPGSTSSMGNVNIGGDAVFQILNAGNSNFIGGGLINGSAAINLTATNLNANSLDVVIDSGQGGGIDGNATINSNITSLTTTTDATYAISLTPLGLHSETAAAAAASPTGINFNGGTYNVGGTFRSTIDGGDGTISFNNAAVRADVIKVGSFGNNGVLRIGGGLLSANTILKLYAPGSNGVIDFVANVTLNNQSAAVVIAAETVTIENGVTVTITGGPPISTSGTPAQVYTDNPNYTGSGGNGSTTGTFAGNGATTIPLSSAPPFDPNASRASSQSGGASIASATTPGGGANKSRTRTAHRSKFAATGHGRSQLAPHTGGAEHRGGIRVADTNHLIELIDNPAALATMGRTKRSDGIKRGSFANSADHSLVSARGSSTNPNQVRVERGPPARP